MVHLRRARNASSTTLSDMAYRIEQHGQQWNVIDESSGNILGRHTNATDAQSQLDGIYTTEPTALVEDLMNSSFTKAAERHHLDW